MGPGDLSGGAGGRRCWRGASQEPDLSPEAPHVQLVGFWHKRGRDEEPLGRREAPAPQPRGPQRVLPGGQGPGTPAPGAAPAVHGAQRAALRGPVAGHMLGAARASAWAAPPRGRTHELGGQHMRPLLPRPPPRCCVRLREGEPQDTVGHSLLQVDCAMTWPCKIHCGIGVREMGGPPRGSRLATPTGGSGCSWSRRACLERSRLLTEVQGTARRLAGCVARETASDRTRCSFMRK